MKDSTILGMAGMMSTAACYATYMICTPDPADGVVFGGVVGAICALGGVLYGFNRKEGNGGTAATRTLKTF